jgi:hypothetical protein
MSISAAEASRLTGRSKQAVINAIKLGKISAVKDVDGTWQIEPVELFRHYQAASSVNGNGDHALDTQLDGARQSLDGVDDTTMLERIIASKDDALRAKDIAIEVLTQENARLTAVVAQLAPPKAKAGWWQRLLSQ